MLSAVIDEMISDAEAKMPTVSPDLESENYRKSAGWGGLLIGAATGAKFGAGIGIAGGPLGAIAGTIPGAVVGGVVGFFSGEKLGANIEVDETDEVEGPAESGSSVCPACGRRIAN
jgi:phage tail tape-measure protein